MPVLNCLRNYIVLFLVLCGIAFAGKKNAQIAMLWCLLPGGGQFYTERYITGTAIGVAEITLGYYAVKYHQEQDYTARNSVLWWGLFVFGYSLADAYVGAKMYGFDVECDIDRVSLSYKIKW
ncbi:hypothetical protein A2Y85_05705 [candidate division WOR-3 bacterium RBG_13_43_14]|uniref:DUF5683 domain-containing protein n=1 Tax=candidate division WOR-3 bacterium RBG_13_43_14 TaxID=1802590 RepID=A0A1F4UE98_UNCW3|nr:MAG: hypothetical protein A2Y85_05705 [candidate division WOR-3 bacterium RBG_13_43_14]